MQIAIDIPEGIYKHTQEYEIGGFSQENDAKIFTAIKHGQCCMNQEELKECL